MIGAIIQGNRHFESIGFGVMVSVEAADWNHYNRSDDHPLYLREFHQNINRFDRLLKDNQFAKLLIFVGFSCQFVGSKCIFLEI